MIDNLKSAALFGPAAFSSQPYFNAAALAATAAPVPPVPAPDVTSEQSFAARQSYIDAAKKNPNGWASKVDEWTLTHSWIYDAIGGAKNANDTKAIQKFIDEKLGQFEFPQNGLASDEYVESTTDNLGKISTKEKETLSEKLTTAIYWAADTDNDRKISKDEWTAAIGSAPEEEKKK